MTPKAEELFCHSMKNGVGWALLIDVLLIAVLLIAIVLIVILMIVMWLVAILLIVSLLIALLKIAISMIAILLTGFSTVSVQLGFCCCLSALVPLVVSCSHTGVPHITRASALLLVLSLCAVSVFGSCCYQGVFLPSWLLVAIQSLS